MAEENTPAGRLPNEPARVKVDHAQGRVRLTYAGQTIVSLGIRVRRDGEVADAKSAGVRLIAVSKHTGWDRIVQTIRIGGVATRPDDTLVFRGTIGVAESEGRPAVPVCVDDGRVWLDTLQCALVFTPAIEMADPGQTPATFDLEATDLMVVFLPRAAASG